MNRKSMWMTAGGGCLVLFLVGVILLVGSFFMVERRQPVDAQSVPATAAVDEVDRPSASQAEQAAVPTFTPRPSTTTNQPINNAAQSLSVDSNGLTGLYETLNPGVVNIQVLVSQGGRQGQGAGSGFILDESGHIVTNNHVVAGATYITVVFHNGFEEEAELIGTDPDSDLAVIKVDSLAEGAHPLALGDSDAAQVGQWVIAIGNPFSLGGSMSLGIISALGRTIPSGATPFSIPQAIQTDAAINPGNSGGPLLNLAGEVIGVNAQIAAQSGGANAGVGFAIPSNVVRRVIPALIEQGHFQWPWLGIRGTEVNLAIQEANDLEVQQGAYIVEVIEGGPAAEAGLQGATRSGQVEGFELPVGGDVVVAVDGIAIPDYNSLLTMVANKTPGDTITLTVHRNGQEQNLDVVLRQRPANQAF